MKHDTVQYFCNDHIYQQKHHVVSFKVRKTHAFFDATYLPTHTKGLYNIEWHQHDPDKTSTWSLSPHVQHDAEYQL